MLGVPITADTPLGDGVGYGGSNGTYGTMIELTGTITLASNEIIVINSGDGVSVSIDG